LDAAPAVELIARRWAIIARASTIASKNIEIRTRVRRVAWPTTFVVARANVLIAELRIREVTEVFLFVALGDRSEGFAGRSAQWHVLVAPPACPSRTEHVVAIAFKFESKRSPFS
jgi:hypothetical protein